MDTEDQPPPLPKRPPTIIRPAPAIPAADKANQNGASRPAPILPSRPAPPRPSSKVPPRPISPTSHSSKPKPQSGQDEPKETKPPSPGGKSSSSGSTRRKLEITIVDARPMSEMGFRDMKKTATVIPTPSTNPVQQSKPPTPPPHVKSTASQGDDNDAAKDGGPIKPAPPSAPARPASASRNSGISLPDDKPPASTTEKGDEPEEAVTRPKSRQPTIIRPQSKLLRQQAMTSQDGNHPDPMEDTNTKTPTSQSQPPAPSLPSSTATAAPKLPPLPSRAPSASPPSLPTSPPPVISPPPISRPPPPKSEPKSNPSKSPPPASRPPPPKPTTAPISSHEPPSINPEPKAPITTSPRPSSTPLSPPPVSRPPPPKPEALPSQQQQQQPPKAAPRPRPRPRSTIIPSTTTITPISEASDATIESNSSSAFSIDKASDTFKPYSQDDNSSVMRPKRPTIIRPQSMIVPPMTRQSMEENDSVLASSPDKIPAKTVIPMLSPPVPTKSPSSPRKRPSRPSAPPVKESSTSSQSADEPENVYETIENVPAEPKTKPNEISTVDRPSLPPPRKESSPKTETTKNITTPTFISSNETDDMPEYSVINKTKSNKPTDDTTTVLIKSPISQSSIAPTPFTSTPNQPEDKINISTDNDDKEDKITTLPVPKQKPKPSVKPKPKPSVKPKPLPKKVTPTDSDSILPTQEVTGKLEKTPHSKPEEKIPASYIITQNDSKSSTIPNTEEPAKSQIVLTTSQNSPVSEVKAKPPAISKRPISIIGRPSLKAKENPSLEVDSNDNNSSAIIDSKSDSSELSATSKVSPPPPKRPVTIIGKPSLDKDLSREVIDSTASDLSLQSSDASHSQSINEVSKVSPPSAHPKRPPTIVGRPSIDNQHITNKEMVKSHSVDDASQPLPPLEPSHKTSETSRQPPKRPVTIIGLPRGSSQATADSLHDDKPDQMSGGRTSPPKPMRPPQVSRPPPLPPAAPVSKFKAPREESASPPTNSEQSQDEEHAKPTESSDFHGDPPRFISDIKSVQHRPPPLRPTGGPLTKSEKTADEEEASKPVEKPNQRPIQNRPPPPRPSGGPSHESITSVIPPGSPRTAEETPEQEKPVQSHPPPPRPSGGPSPSSQRQSLPPPADDDQDYGKGGLPSLPPRPFPGHALYHYMANEPHGIASHDYTASQSDELSFKAGDVILITREVDQDWLSGKLGDQEGIFPRAFIELNYDSAMEPSHTEALEDTIDEKPDNLTGPRCRARFDFEGEGEGELAFEDGDVIQLLGHVGSEWMKGELNSIVGIFPSAFVEIIEDVSSEDGKVDMAQSNVTTAMFDFDGQEGELSFQAGDEIDVQSQVNSEWLFGEYAGRTGKFPATFVSHIPPSLPQYRDKMKEGHDGIDAGNEDTGMRNSKEIHAGGEINSGRPKATMYCIATHDYNSGTGGDLVMQVGDRIEILEFVGEDWIEGCCNGERGLFPSNFVTMDGENKDVPSEQPKGEMVPPPQQAIALHDFDGETDEDLTFKAGDTIELLDFVDDNQQWRWGLFQGKRGIFPAAFVESC